MRTGACGKIQPRAERTRREESVNGFHKNTSACGKSQPEAERSCVRVPEKGKGDEEDVKL